jgi:hypothetical protein
MSYQNKAFKQPPLNSVQASLNALNKKSYNPNSVNYQGNTPKFDGSTKSGNFGQLMLVRYFLHLEAITMGADKYLDGLNPSYIRTVDEIEEMKPTLESVQLSHIASMIKKLMAAEKETYKDLLAEYKSHSHWLPYILGRKKMNRDEIDYTRVKDTSDSTFTASNDSYGRTTIDPDTIEYQEDQFDRAVARFREFFPEYNFEVCEQGERVTELSFKQKEEIARGWQEDRVVTKNPHLFTEPPTLVDHDDIATVAKEFQKQLGSHVIIKNENTQTAANVMALIKKYFAPNVLTPYKEEIARNEHNVILDGIQTTYGSEPSAAIASLNQRLLDYKFLEETSYEQFKEDIKLLFTQLLIAMIAEKQGKNFNPIDDVSAAHDLNWDISDKQMRSLGVKKIDLLPSSMKALMMIRILKKNEKGCSQHFTDAVAGFETSLMWKGKQTFQNLMKVLDYHNQAKPKPIGGSRKHPRSEDHEETEAKPRKKGSATQEEIDKGLACPHCHRRGHVSAGCFDLHPELRNNRPTSNAVQQQYVKKEKQTQGELPESDPNHWSKVTEKLKSTGCSECYESHEGSRKKFANTHGLTHPKNKLCGYSEEVKEKRAQAQARRSASTTDETVPLNDLSGSKTKHPKTTAHVAKSGSSAPEYPKDLREKRRLEMIKAQTFAKVKTLEHQEYMNATADGVPPTLAKTWDEHWAAMVEYVQSLNNGNDYSVLLLDDDDIEESVARRQTHPDIPLEEQELGITKALPNRSVVTPTADTRPPAYTSDDSEYARNLADLLKDLPGEDEDDKYTSSALAKSIEDDQMDVEEVVSDAARLLDAANNSSSLKPDHPESSNQPPPGPTTGTNQSGSGTH